MPGSGYFQNLRPEVADFLPAHYSKVLEIGCGDGNFHANLKKSCEYWGIEPDKDAAEIAWQKLNKVLMGTYEAVDERLPDHYFDLVICNDVIEHMIDHEAFFKKIKNKLKENSYIIGSIPNVRYIGNLYELLIKKDWQYQAQGILDRTHLRFFTEKSFKRTITENNFIVEEFHGIVGAEFKSSVMVNFSRRLLSYFVGKDTQFLQFGFRVKCTNQN